ncbi:MAG TPA: PAS domain-containing protein, partial [Candidatus Bathyarchaeia archaeon]|nr:PAS domain-containing protein [Candidatus Bathyarchaeia archaeon]
MDLQPYNVHPFLPPHLLHFLDTLPHGIMLVDQDGIILHVNPAGCQLLGLRLAEIQHHHVTRIAPGTDILQVIREGKPSMRVEIRYGDKMFLVDRIPFSLNGELVGGISVFQDITFYVDASKRISEQQRELHQFRELVEQLYDGIVMCDRAGIVTMINQTYCDFLGTTMEEAIGKPITEVIENTRMPQVMETGVAELGHLMRVGNRDILVSRMPLREGDKIVGALGKVIFNDLRELRNLVERYNLMESKLDYYRQEWKRVVGARYTFHSIFADHP